MRDGAKAETATGEAVSPDEVVDAAESSMRALVGLAGVLGGLADFARFPYAAGRTAGQRAATRESAPTPTSTRISTPVGSAVDPFEPEVEAPPADPSAGRSPGISMRASLDGAWQYHGLWRGRLGFELDTRARVGAAAHLYLWGNPAARDDLLLADLRLHLLVGNWRRAMLRVGAGLDVLHSRALGFTAIGGEWSVSGEIFPVRPLVLSFDAAVGKIGHGVYVSGRATVGIAIRRVELFGGYEHKLIGVPGIGGPLFGLRVWF